MLKNKLAMITINMVMNMMLKTTIVINKMTEGQDLTIKIKTRAKWVFEVKGMAFLDVLLNISSSLFSLLPYIGKGKGNAYA